MGRSVKDGEGVVEGRRGEKEFEEEERREVRAQCICLRWERDVEVVLVEEERAVSWV